MKVSKSVSLNATIWLKIEETRRKRGFTSLSQALEEILKEYFEKKERK